MTTLQERLDGGEVIILDGAIGTELQRMGVPLDADAWSAPGHLTHPGAMRHLHEEYIQAGVDVITTNTYSSARHNLEVAGLGDRTRELNTRAVTLAQEARDRAGGTRTVYIAGALSNYGAFSVTVGRPAPPMETLKASYREQAEILAEAGVDLFVQEMVRDIQQGAALLDAALATGLPVWLGFSCRTDEDGTVRFLHNPTDLTFAEGLDALAAIGGSAVTVMHSDIEVTPPALKVALERWQGPVGSYPHYGHWERPIWHSQGAPSPEEYLRQAKEWVEMGVQIIGGCCGIGIEHIRPLKEGLPARVPAKESP